MFLADSAVSAHRLDEYLQAARVGLQPEGVAIELDLTPGIAVAESILATIDHDRDGSISSTEQQAYAEDVVRALQIELDGEPLPLRLVSVTFPDVSAFRRGEGMIRLRASAYRSLSAGGHQLLFRNVHLGHQSVYLANALVPANARVAVTGQRRDGNQSELTIEYSVRPAWAEAAPAWFLVSVMAVVLMVRFRRRTDRD